MVTLSPGFGVCTAPTIVRLSLRAATLAAAITACGRGTPNARLATAVDSLMATLTADTLPGCAVGVYRDGEVLLARGYGVANLETGAPITTTTAFTLGSVSKQFTALAALLLEKDGRLSLDDDVRRFLPELRVSNPPIRIRDLLQHTSGIRDYETLAQLSARPVSTMPAFIDLIAAQRALNFTPGTQHEYSHSDYVLLGAVIERVTGETFARHMERAVFGPLGMVDTRIDDGATSIRNRAIGHLREGGAYHALYPSEHLVGGDNVHTTVADYARWDRNFTEGTVGGRALVQQMTTRPTLANGDTIPYAYGLRLSQYRGTPIIQRGSNSKGTRTEVHRVPDHHVAVATFCNSGELMPGQIGEQIIDLHLAGVLDPPERGAGATDGAPPAVPATPAELEALAGVYRPAADPWNVLRIAVHNGKLAEILGDTIQTFTHVGNRQFTGDGSPPPYRYTFTPLADGRVRLVASFREDTLETAERPAASVEWRASPTALAGYGGTYYSADLDTGWRLTPRADTLLLQRQGERDVILLPFERDTLIAQIGSWDELITARIDVTRSPGGAVTGLLVTTPSGEGSIRRLRFDRVEAR